MKRTRLVLVAAMALAMGSSYAVTLNNDAQRVGYAIGADMGSSLNQLQGGDKSSIDFNALIVGLQAAYQGQELAMSKDEMTKTMQTFAQARMQKMQAEMKQKADENLAAGNKFLAEKAKEDGVQTTASGLEYKVDEAGTGAQPKADDTVSVIYTGKLIDGTVFDSSEKHGGKPITFKVQDVIPGWVEGLQLMKEGGKYTFYIPAKLAYGERGAGPAIPPNSTLVFDVHLVKVEKAAAASDDEASLSDDAKATASAAVKTAKEATHEAASALGNASKNAANAVGNAAQKAGDAVKDKLSSDESSN